MIRFRFVEDHRDVYDVKRMCALVELPRSSFYTWAAGPTAAAEGRQAADAELAAVIEQIWLDSRRTYGWPRVWGQLTRRRGVTVSRRRVARIMREHGFVGVHTRRRWRRGRPDVAPAADRLQRVFTAERPNLRWVADITEFPTGEGKLHLAAIRDLCHRIVGWDTDEHQDATLVVDALTMALGRTAADRDGLIHHSDRGTQGELNRSSQHLDPGGGRWRRCGSGSGRSSCIEDRCRRRGGRQWRGARIGSGSGRRSLVV